MTNEIPNVLFDEAGCAYSINKPTVPDSDNWVRVYKLERGCPPKKQMQIQNALRVLSHVMPSGVTLEFGNGDLVYVSDHRGEGETKHFRTQDLAEAIHKEDF